MAGLGAHRQLVVPLNRSLQTSASHCLPRESRNTSSLLVKRLDCCALRTSDGPSANTSSLPSLPPCPSPLQLAADDLFNAPSLGAVFCLVLVLVKMHSIAAFLSMPNKDGFITGGRSTRGFDDNTLRGYYWTSQALRRTHSCCYRAAIDSFRV